MIDLCLHGPVNVPETEMLEIDSDRRQAAMITAA